MSRIAPARAAAFDILLAVERGSGHSDELLQADAVEKLSPQDRNLTTNLVMGTLRWQIALDARIAGFLAKPKAQLDPAVRIALRMGAFQLLHLDRVPAYAAIGESVELAKQAGNRFAAGMVNAVLRKVAALSGKKNTHTVTNTKALALATAHPQWLVERWAHHFGLEQTKALCEYDQQPASVFLRLASPDVEQELLQDGMELAGGSFLSNVRKVMRGDVYATRAFQQRRVRVQDEGSQLIAELAGHGKKILDVCAAPGGKTAVLAERNAGASIAACDVSRRRLMTMQKLLAGVVPEGAIEYVTADAANQTWPAAFDLVLCDAPCSGTGTIARNPEIRHRLHEEDLQRQQERQVAILSAAMGAVKAGGRVVYSTCSLELEENEEVIRACLSLHPEFELVRMDGEVDRLERDGVLTAQGAQRLRETALQNGYLRTIPGVHDCDGFFAALLVR